MSKRYDSNRRRLQVGEYQRGNGTYEYKWRDKYGKRHSFYAPTLKDLREKKKEIIRDNLDGINIDKNKITLNDLFYLWVKVKRGIKDNTLKNYIYMYQEFVEKEIGNIRISDLKKTDIKSYYNMLAETKKIKISTIDNIQTVVHQVLEVAVEDDYLRYNPADKALKDLKKTHRKTDRNKKALTSKEQKVFEKYLMENKEYSRWQPVFCVMLWTGMRVGEATGLQWENIDFEKNIIYINQTLVYYSKGKGKGNKYAMNSPKTDSSKRIIPMTSNVRDALLLQRKFIKDNNLQCKSNIDGYDDFVFLNRFGEVLNQGVMNKALRRIVNSCNLERMEGEKKGGILLPYISNHSLRHTFTTRMCEAGVNIKVMQEVLGHASSDITMDIYAKATDDFKEIEMNIFDEFINKIQLDYN
ncbi:site-specific integrase [Peptostreptococcus faecalis]|uniref:site-specific integrase n=1 Tax=Peptostreptococcus faecalis TaxID=2045015 RepID=UPI000C7B86AD|nr:site-specific integrase [Peptostreptococcus faecalis]